MPRRIVDYTWRLPALSKFFFCATGSALARCEDSSMDIIAFVAERKIEEAMERGAFDRLTPMGCIDCSLRGERFIAKWFRDKFHREELEVEILIKKPGG